MLKRRASQHGLSLVEVMVVVSLAVILLMAGAPTFSAWLGNARLRSASESILSGLQLARAEAVNRNARVRFQFVTTLDNSCALSASSFNWVVNLDPEAVADEVAGKCGMAPDDAVAPRILRKPDGIATPAGMVVETGGVTNVVFNGLGRPISLPAGNVNIDITNPAAGDCLAAGGPVTCLRIVVSPAGQVRMCNPKFSLPDPQGC